MGCDNQPSDTLSPWTSLPGPVPGMQGHKRTRKHRHPLEVTVFQLRSTSRFGKRSSFQINTPSLAPQVPSCPGLLQEEVLTEDGLSAVWDGLRLLATQSIIFRDQRNLELEKSKHEMMARGYGITEAQQLTLPTPR